MVADLAKLQVVCHAAACKETRCGDRSATSASRRAKDGLLKWHGQVNVLRHDVGSLAAWEGCAQQDCTSTDEVPPSGCNFLGEDWRAPAVDMQDCPHFEISSDTPDGGTTLGIDSLDGDDRSVASLCRAVATSGCQTDLSMSNPDVASHLVDSPAAAISFGLAWMEQERIIDHQVCREKAAMCLEDGRWEFDMPSEECVLKSKMNHFGQAAEIPGEVVELCSEDFVSSGTEGLAARTSSVKQISLPSQSRLLALGGMLRVKVSFFVLAVAFSKWKAIYTASLQETLEKHIVKTMLAK